MSTPGRSPRAHRLRARALAASTLVWLLGACSMGTLSLPPGGEDASDRADATPDRADVPRTDLASPDTGLLTQCRVAADCPGAFPTCDAPGTSCGCGCYRACLEGRCTPYCDDRPSCHGDAGVATDAGSAPGSCTRAQDWPPLESPAACGGGTRSSCAFGQCVADCEGPRACVLEADACVRCTFPRGDTERACPACASIPISDGAIESSSCELPRGSRLDFQFEPLACTWRVTMPDLRRAGSLVMLERGWMLGSMDGFGGPCLVSFAPTGALRTVWSCPGCTFTVFHF